jgi:hypothetical protein
MDLSFYSLPYTGGYALFLIPARFDTDMHPERRYQTDAPFSAGL